MIADTALSVILPQMLMRRRSSPRFLRPINHSSRVSSTCSRQTFAETPVMGGRSISSALPTGFLKLASLNAGPSPMVSQAFDAAPTQRQAACCDGFDASPSSWSTASKTCTALEQDGPVGFRASVSIEPDVLLVQRARSHEQSRRDGARQAARHPNHQHNSSPSRSCENHLPLMRLKRTLWNLG